MAKKKLSVGIIILSVMIMVGFTGCSSLGAAGAWKNDPVLEGFSYRVNEENTAVSITHFDFAVLTDNTVIPSEIDGLPVTVIGKAVFKRGGIFQMQGKALKNLTIPEGVKTIEDEAFNANLLTALTLPSTLETIGNEAFSYNQLASIDLSTCKNLTSIGGQAFSNNKLTSIDLSACENLASIMSAAFHENKLNSVILPANANKIHGTAFGRGNKDLTFTINGAGLLTTANNGKVLIQNGDTIVAAAAPSGSMRIPEGIKVINSYVFYSCDELTSVLLPEGLTTVESEAFTYCRNLKSVSLPAGITLASEAFDNCNLLMEVEIRGPLAKMESSSFPYLTVQKKNVYGFDSDAPFGLWDIYAKGGPGTYIRSAGVFDTESKTIRLAEKGTPVTNTNSIWTKR